MQFAKFRLALDLTLVSLAISAPLCAQPISLAPGVNYAVGPDPERVAIADLSRDGIPDLSITNFVSNTISILLGRSDGTFSAA